MTNQVQQSIKSCTLCLQQEVHLPKVSLHLIVSTSPMDLLHIDFTSIKMTMEPNSLPKVANVLVFQDHFTRHMMAYVTQNQTAKTVTKFLYQGYISFFGALWCKLHEQHWQDVQTPQHEEVANHTLSSPDEGVGREVPSNYHADDWEAGRR